MITFQRTLFSACVLFFSYGVAAQADTLAVIKTANPDATPYEVLKKFYETASSPAKIADFDTYGAAAGLRCAGAEASDTVASPYLTLMQYQIDVQKSEGPLFPGIKRTVLIPNVYTTENGYTHEQVDAVAGAITVSSAPTDLIFLQTTPKGIDDPNGFSPIKVFIRENDSMIAEKITYNSGGRNQKTVYAYCWR